MQIQQFLAQLDFTPQEAQVYYALIEKGTSSVGPLIASTDLHRNVVYTALEHLVNRKLVSEVAMRGKKVFSVVSPLQLQHEFEEKAALAKAAAEDIAKRLKTQPQEITVHQGNDEYLSLLTGIIDSLPKGSTKYVMGTGGEDFMRETMRPIWKKYHAVARARKISIHMLSYESQRGAIESDVGKENIYQVRYLPDRLENPAGIHIYPEANIVLNIIYSDAESPVTAIKIRNEKLVESYLNLFRNLWKIAVK